ncbi:hypothetical protein AB205_0218490 [Aquarana catesbeiana]|uniref:Uncharacterized protein n=1 Tax=Aquarana catesbeiana TaxID=8400 RepID=A0A2G9SFJ9_AQUCT|nr:hypothetical protein AB205_0218490 [Aquarana catesbeiana]
MYIIIKIQISFYLAYKYIAEIMLYVQRKLQSRYIGKPYFSEGNYGRKSHPCVITDPNNCWTTQGRIMGAAKADFFLKPNSTFNASLNNLCGPS